MVQEDDITTKTMWKRVGFFRHTPEYWLLGSLLTDRIASSTTSGRVQDNKTSQSSLDHASSSSGTLVNSVTFKPILDKYDQTSMRQVNDLITDFRRFQMEERI